METDRGRVPGGVGGGENSSQNIEIFRNTKMYEMTNQKISETKIKENYKVNENDNYKEDDKDKVPWENRGGIFFTQLKYL